MANQAEEFRLARQMKNTCCDESGIETHKKKAAKVLHEIGVLYRNKSPEKISLIKSAGLFNAAIIRNPSNVSQINSALLEICHHVLQQAKAKNQKANLIKKAEEIKDSMQKMRRYVKGFLKSVQKIPEGVTGKKLQTLKLNKISSIQQINKNIADKYIQIMAEISAFCHDVMTEPPCEYAIVGMGSLARQEITPYSDFEHIILLSNNEYNKSYLEHFKWFSVIFHIVILNIQETIIPSLNIFSLNDKDSPLGDWYYDAITPSGLSFDGMMPHACKFPLGRQQHTKNKQFTTELIKPVSEMLDYLCSKADLKNGYHLTDILTRTCYVFGNKAIFAQFENKVNIFLSKQTKTDNIHDIKQQVNEDLTKFSTRFRLSKLKLQETINIKQLVYRSSTIFITALARIHNISENSCFDVIDKLEEHQRVSKITAVKLRFAVATACEMRLRVYAQNDRQCDNAIDLKDNLGIEKFLDIVGVASTINYFQIAYCLQCEIAKQLKFAELHFYSDAQLINITIGLAFGIRNFANFYPNQRKHFWNSDKFDFDKCIEHLEKDINLSSSLIQKISKTFSKNVSRVFKIGTMLSSEEIQAIANYLRCAEKYDDALEFYKEVLDSISKNEQADSELATANHYVGYCLYYLNQPQNALKYFNKTLQFNQNLAKSFSQKEISGSLQMIASTLNYVGYSHMKLHQYYDAIVYLKQAMQMRKSISVNVEPNLEIGWALHNIGSCHMFLHHHQLALTFLNEALHFYRNTNQSSDSANCFAATCHVIGNCWYYTNKPEKALEYLHQSLETILTLAGSNVCGSKDIAAAHYDIGLCHMSLKQYKLALNNLNRALVHYQNSSHCDEKESRISATIKQIRRCHNRI